MSTATAPLEIGLVALTVNDLASVAAFYETALGLDRLFGSGDTVTLGAGNRPLLELRADRNARRSSHREAGLFHTAFLLPGRADLGAWLRHATDARLPLAGAADHDVSEAIYLADPEGNGIEVYTDRPRSLWKRHGDQIVMTSEAPDLNAIAAAATQPWKSAPDGTVVGHVHLQVGALPEAEAFYTETLGFTLTCRYPGASFFGTGGYHHHLAANVWNSRGARLRSAPVTGLAGIEILAAPAEVAAIKARTGQQAAPLTDPWGTHFTLTEKDA